MQQLIKYYQDNYEEILNWIQAKFVFEEINLPLFSSTDIRNSGFKTSHVDLNLFPSGFNNIDSHAVALSANLCTQYLDLYYPNVSKIIIYPEQFSRNQKYLESLETLCKIIAGTGRKFGVIFSDELFDEIEMNHKMRILDLEKNATELIILNNDLTDGIPEFLSDYQGTIIPSPKLGWHSRRKSEHFIRFNYIVDAVAEQFDFDPWLIYNYNDTCLNVDFRERKNLESIANSVDKMIEKIRKKYDEYQVDSDPYVYIKSNQGTFGLGIMTVRSSDEVLNINKKRRHSMQKIKLGVENNQVLIQEGVPTIGKSADGHTSEELIYSVFAHPACIFDRINSEVDEFSNLNSRGMTFENCRILPQDDIRYLINKIANIATAYEEY